MGGPLKPDLAWKIGFLRGFLAGDRAYAGPYMAAIDVTRRCNLRCIGCRSNSPEKSWRPDLQYDDFNWAEFVNLCEQLQAMGTRKMILVCGDARNQAMPLARAGIVAFVDADCYVEDAWAEAVCEAHRQDNLLAGGVINNAPTRNLVSWAYYFCEFSIWLPAKHKRRIAEMAGCCLSMKRAAFERYGPFVEGTYCSDTAFQWKTRRDGIEILFSPAIRVYRQSPGELGGFLGHIYEHRRAFARVKCRERRLSLPMRFAELALLTVAPFLLLGTTLSRLRFCWSYVPRFVAASPLIFLGYIARSCGEFAGYLRPNTQN